MKTQSNSLAVHSAEMSDPSFIFDTAYAVEFSDPFFFIPPKGLSAYITLLPEIDLLSLVNVSLSAYFI